MRELERAAVDHLGQVRGAEPLLQLLQRVLPEDPGVPGPHFPAPDDHAVAACGFTSGKTRAGGERASRRRAVAAARNPSGALKFLAIWERSPGRTLPPACLIARMSRPLSSRPEGGAGGPRPGKWDILGPPNPSRLVCAGYPRANRFSPTAAAESGRAVTGRGSVFSLRGPRPKGRAALSELRPRPESCARTRTSYSFVSSERRSSSARCRRRPPRACRTDPRIPEETPDLVAQDGFGSSDRDRRGRW